MYLYIPLGGNKSTKLRQLASIFFSFTFIALWHGYSYSIIMWSLANCIILMTETLLLKILLKNQTVIFTLSFF